MKIKEILYNNISNEKWNDWHWQMQNRIQTLNQLKELFDLNDLEMKEIKMAGSNFPFAITPYYASLMDFSDPQCPIRKQAIPSKEELNVEAWEMADPLGEEKDSSAPGITHRYPDRVLFTVTTECSMYCRHCTRKRKVGDKAKTICESQIDTAIAYIEKQKQIRDVLISGGDPLLLSDEKLESLIKKLRAIPHIEIIRIGSRVPVVMPQRITYKFVEMLKKYHPIWFNTHFNHPKEITTESKKAIKLLADAGIPLGNQSVLLRGVNDCPGLMKKLVHELVLLRIRPYYIYQCDLSYGLSHFRTTIAKGLEIMESLRGHTSGYAVPTYVVDAPGGGGKIPLMPNYVLSQRENMTILRNFEGVITAYNEPIDYKSKCSDSCSYCSENNNDPIGLMQFSYGDTRQEKTLEKVN